MMAGDAELFAGLDQSRSLQVSRLVAAAEHYSTISPALSRFYMSKVERMKHAFGMKASPSDSCCQFCGSIFRPDNHTVRTIPRMKTNSKLARFILRRAEGKVTSLHKHLAMLYIHRSTRVVMTCTICLKRTVIKTKRNPELNLPVVQTECTRLQVEDMSTVEKKKLRKKMKKKRRRNEGSDSGLDLSFKDNLSRRGAVDGDQTPTLGAPQYASTPLSSINLLKARTGLKPSPGPAPPPNPFADFIKPKDKAAIPDGKKGKKKKSSKKTLQNILQQQNKRSEMVKGGGLLHFLSGL